LESDLAFASNSAVLSAQAKAKIALVATQVRQTGLTGAIYVDGYTDNVGSAAYGQVLSERRAQAVADYLTGLLGTTGPTVVPVGHGEANPIESNATAAGRAANRRVTITLPKS
jgi:outer membrane protein OmpA-like peptidoglycan-associated protein